MIAATLLRTSLLNNVSYPRNYNLAHIVKKLDDNLHFSHRSEEQARNSTGNLRALSVRD